MAHEHVVRRRVAFSEVDAGGIVHFTNLYRYAEDAEHDFLRQVGLSVVTEDGPRLLGWPRVATSCDFFSPLRFEDWFQTHLLVKKIGRRSITYLYEIRKLDDHQAPTELIAQGQTTAVCVEGIGSGGIRSVDIPEVVTSKIKQAPEEKLFVHPKQRK
ncbi:MAG: thioesterase family protein [Phycisphaeraceae bacterium]|nr:thioesterase family protein [Phycisphaeraceae bacterium]